MNGTAAAENNNEGLTIPLHIATERVINANDIDDVRYIKSYNNLYRFQVHMTEH